MSPQASSSTTDRPLAGARPRPGRAGKPVRARLGLRHHRRREYLLFLLLLSPNLLIVGTFDYWPVIYNAYLSMTSWNMLSGTPAFVGLDNYVDLFSDPDFLQILINTVLFTGAVVCGSVAIGLALAVLFHQRLRGRGLVRTVAFAPHIVSGAAIATLWLFIFDPNYGLTRVIMQPLGIAPPHWVNDSDWALVSLMVVYTWKGMGFTAIVYLAGLQGMPEDLYDAAKIDGAGAWTTFRRITLPLLSPVTFFITVVTIIGTFQAYDIIAVMTGGGPGISTTTLSWYIYEQGFRVFNAGRGAASAMILFFILILVTWLQTRFVQRKVHYR